RGPQTPGELKQRGERIHAFADLAEVHATLGALIERGLVARLERRPGQKEERYAQLLSEDERPPNGAALATFASLAHGGEAFTASGAGSAAGQVGSESVAAFGQGAGRASVAAAGNNGGGGSERGLIHELSARVERLEREVAELRGVIRS